MSIYNFMLSWVAHGHFFITSEPGLRQQTFWYKPGNDFMANKTNRIIPLTPQTGSCSSAWHWFLNKGLRNISLNSKFRISKLVICHCQLGLDVKTKLARKNTTFFEDSRRFAIFTDVTGNPQSGVIILLNLEGKKCSSRLVGSSWAASSGTTLFAFVFLNSEFDMAWTKHYFWLCLRVFCRLPLSAFRVKEYSPLTSIKVVWQQWWVELHRWHPGDHGYNCHLVSLPFPALNKIDWLGARKETVNYMQPVNTQISLWNCAYLSEFSLLT